MSIPTMTEYDEELAMIGDEDYDGYDEKGGYWVYNSADESNDSDVSFQPDANRIVIDTVNVLMHQYLDSTASLLGLTDGEKELVSDTLQAFITDKKNTL